MIENTLMQAGSNEVSFAGGNANRHASLTKETRGGTTTAVRTNTDIKINERSSGSKLVSEYGTVMRTPMLMPH